MEHAGVAAIHKTAIRRGRSSGNRCALHMDATVLKNFPILVRRRVLLSTSHYTAAMVSSLAGVRGQPASSCAVGVALPVYRRNYTDRRNTLVSA